jgi:tRNA-dihydrouridine synthase A
LKKGLSAISESQTCVRKYDEMNESSHKFCFAPMMDITDRHCRYFMRLMSHHVRLYTEMLTAEALLHGDAVRLLAFDAAEHPVACQIGGAQPGRLAAAARLAARTGYDEINLNVGCPSHRVHSGRFGACLMAEPDLVAQCIDAMKNAVDVPVTVKCRLGIDDQDPRAALFTLTEKAAAAGCSEFIVHARKAWLKGLSPRENRNIPPLDYEPVDELKAARPDLTIILNGGIASLDEAAVHLERFDGVMLGRTVYEHPFMLADVDGRFFGDARKKASSPDDVMERFMPYVEAHCAQGTPLHAMTRHILGLYHGRPGARAFRRHLSTHGTRYGAGPQVLRAALELLRVGPARAAA